jgi:dolichol-phosphate mannosyltransferase
LAQSLILYKQRVYLNHPGKCFAILKAGWEADLQDQSVYQKTVDFCLIVPCYNEEEMLPAFFNAVTPALEEATQGNWSIVCVDDGSRDATFALIAAEHIRDARIRGVRLSRNFGHQAALSAGLAYARGAYIGIMDSDLQDPVEVLVKLYKTCVQDQLDVCFGVRGKRDAPLFLRLAYSAFYRIINRAADHEWPRNAGDFCVFSARCQQVLLALPEQSRMLRGLRSWVGFRQLGIVYDRPARLHGVSKYNLRRLVALALQGLISFSNIPLRLASLMGVGMGFFSIVFGVLVLINRLFPSFSLFGYSVGANGGVATMLLFLALTFSILFLCLGIIGEYLVVLLHELKNRPTAIVDSVIGEMRPYQSSYAMLSVDVLMEKRSE